MGQFAGERLWVELLWVSLLAAVILESCATNQELGKHLAASPRLTPPFASLIAVPGSIPIGSSVHLSWRTRNATSVLIKGIGQVAPEGFHLLKPSQSTIYTLIAKGPGGTRKATARVTVYGVGPPPFVPSSIR